MTQTSYSNTVGAPENNNEMVRKAKEVLRKTKRDEPFKLEVYFNDKHFCTICKSSQKLLDEAKLRLEVKFKYNNISFK